MIRDYGDDDTTSHYQRLRRLTAELTTEEMANPSAVDPGCGTVAAALTRRGMCETCVFVSEAAGARADVGERGDSLLGGGRMFCVYRSVLQS